MILRLINLWLIMVVCVERTTSRHSCTTRLPEGTPLPTAHHGDGTQRNGAGAVLRLATPCFPRTGP